MKHGAPESIAILPDEGVFSLPLLKKPRPDPSLVPVDVFTSSRYTIVRVQGAGNIRYGKCGHKADVIETRRHGRSGLRNQRVHLGSLTPRMSGGGYQDIPHRAGGRSIHSSESIGQGQSPGKGLLFLTFRHTLLRPRRPDMLFRSEVGPLKLVNSLTVRLMDCQGGPTEIPPLRVRGASCTDKGAPRRPGCPSGKNS